MEDITMDYRGRPAQRPYYDTYYDQLGFQSDYLRSDIILDPILEILRDNATKWDRKKYMAPYTSIIGPTMSGKTRLIMELAKIVPVVYICLHPERSAGLPSRSKLANYLLPDQTRLASLQLHYVTLLVAILQVVTEYFTSPEVATLDQEAQVTSWYEYSFPTDGKTDTGEFAARVMLKMDTLQNSGKFPNLREALHNYSELCITQDDRLKIVLAIDEARSMLELNFESEISPFCHLRQVLSQVTPGKGFFALFTDVANFCPSLQDDPSARLEDLFPPIYQIQTLDLFASEPKTWKELISPNRLLNYGTPFYGPFFQKAEINMGAAAAIKEVILIAQNRLICTKTLPTMSQAQIFALLGPIIQPALYTAWDLNVELLASHAAHCMHISSTQDKVVCQYPSQPIYATAAHHFLASDDTKWVACINGLTLAVQQGFVSIGDAGELATNLILMRAMNQTMKKVEEKKKAAEKSPDKRDSSGQLDWIFGDDKNKLIPYGHPVRLKDFLEVLTGKEAGQIHLGSTKEELEIKNKLLNEGIIFFNHLILVRYTPDAKSFLEYLYRGVAVQCKPGQPGFKQLFTIYLKPTSDTSNSSCLSEKNISYCGIQVKHHQGSMDWAESDEWTTTTAEIKGIKNPYLVILFNLTGSTPKEPKVLTEDDPNRVLLEIHGLSDIGCLTTTISNALDELKNAGPDLTKMGDRDSQMEKWVKSINPGT